MLTDIPPVDPRLEAIKGVLGMLTDEGGKIFSPTRLDEISKSILYWIDKVEGRTGECGDAK